MKTIKEKVTGVEGRCVMNGVEYTFKADFEYQWSRRCGILNCDVEYVEDIIRVSDGCQLFDEEAEAWEKDFIEQVRVGTICPFDDFIRERVA